MVGAACSCLRGSKEPPEMCSSVDSWITDAKTIAIDGGVDRRMRVSVAISATSLDTHEIVGDKKQSTLHWFMNSRKKQ